MNEAMMDYCDYVPLSLSEPKFNSRVMDLATQLGSVHVRLLPRLVRDLTPVCCRAIIDHSKYVVKVVWRGAAQDHAI